MTANTWFKVKGSKVKVTAYVTANTDSLKYVSFRDLGVILTSETVYVRRTGAILTDRFR